MKLTISLCNLNVIVVSKKSFYQFGNYTVNRTSRSVEKWTSMSAQVKTFGKCLDDVVLSVTFNGCRVMKTGNSSA